MAFPKNPKGKKTPTEPVVEPTIQTQIPDDVPGVEETEVGAPVSGPPATASEPVVQLTVSQLDERIQAAVNAAIAARPTANTGGASAGEIAAAVAAAIMQSQQAQVTAQHASMLAQAQAREAKKDKCTLCRQTINGCGGLWLHKSRIDDPRLLKLVEEKLVTLPETLNYDKDGYLLSSGKRRFEVPLLNHYKMVVYPRNDENAEWFPGLRINGTWYVSNGPGHEIWVPLVNDFAATLAGFEVGEKRLRTPRKMIRQSGSISGTPGGGSNFQRPTFDS